MQNSHRGQRKAMQAITDSELPYSLAAWLLGHSRESCMTKPEGITEQKKQPIPKTCQKVGDERAVTAFC